MATPMATDDGAIHPSPPMTPLRLNSSETQRSTTVNQIEQTDPAATKTGENSGTPESIRMQPDGTIRHSNEPDLNRTRQGVKAVADSWARRFDSKTQEDRVRSATEQILLLNKPDSKKSSAPENIPNLAALMDRSTSGTARQSGGVGSLTPPRETTSGDAPKEITRTSNTPYIVRAALAANRRKKAAIENGDHGTGSKTPESDENRHILHANPGDTTHAGKASSPISVSPSSADHPELAVEVDQDAIIIDPPEAAGHIASTATHASASQPQGHANTSPPEPRDSSESIFLAVDRAFSVLKQVQVQMRNKDTEIADLKKLVEQLRGQISGSNQDLKDTAPVVKGKKDGGRKSAKGAAAPVAGEDQDADDEGDWSQRLRHKRKRTSYY